MTLQDRCSYPHWLGKFSAAPQPTYRKSRGTGHLQKSGQLHNLEIPWHTHSNKPADHGFRFLNVNDA